jgi:putative membrane protein
MHIGKRYRVLQTLQWSRAQALVPLAYATTVVAIAMLSGWRMVGIPTLPLVLVGTAVAFYLGFKNNASYDRLWEARKIWGGIVNTSRSWAVGVIDLVSTEHGGSQSAREVAAIKAELVRRHIAWLDALRYQLRKRQTWEHDSPMLRHLRQTSGVPEYVEPLPQVLERHLSAAEAQQAMASPNPAVALLAVQSRRLAELQRAGLLDGFAHMQLRTLLQELIAEQGRAERIKNFPFPRQYATVNSMFAGLFTLILPFGLMAEFAKMGGNFLWLAAPFSALVSWVFLTTDRIGDWSENPFEGLANDVPISAISRNIERDLLSLLGETELPAPREAVNQLLF